MEHVRHLLKEFAAVVVPYRVRPLLLQILFGLVSPLVRGRFRLADTASTIIVSNGTNVRSDDTRACQGSDHSDGNGLRKRRGVSIHTRGEVSRHVGMCRENMLRFTSLYDAHTTAS